VRVGAAVAGALGVGGFAVVLRAAEESDKTIAQFNQALVQSGRFSEETSKGYQDLATSLQLATAESDEAILDVMRRLVSFGNVAEDQIPRATRVALDLAAALGTDGAQAAQQLARALADPAQGLTALRRAGITFSAGQKEVIRQLVESGNRAQALDVILGALESRVGGQAAIRTLGDRFRLLQQVVGDVLEVYGKLLTQSPLVNAAFEAGAGRLAEFAASGAGVAEQQAALEGTLRDAALAASDLVDRVRPAYDIVVRFLGTVVAGYETLPSPLRELGLIGILALGTRGRVAVVAGLSLVDTLSDSYRGLQETLRGRLDFGDFATSNKEELQSLLEDLDRLDGRAKSLGTSIITTAENFRSTGDAFRDLQREGKAIEDTFKLLPGEFAGLSEEDREDLRAEYIEIARQATSDAAEGARGAARTAVETFLSEVASLQKRIQIGGAPGAAIGPGGDPQTRENTRLATKDAGEYRRVIESIGESAQRAAERTALLRIPETDRSRAQAAIDLAGSIREIEEAELRAVEAARGHQDKLVEAHRLAGEAIKQITLEYQAKLVGIDRDATDERARIERDRGDALRQLQLDLLPAQARTQAEAILAAQDLFAERQKLFRDNPAALALSQDALNLATERIVKAKDATVDWAKVMESATGTIIADFAGGISDAFMSFIDGTQSAGEAFESFAADVLRSVEQIVVKMLVLAGLKAAAGFFGFTLPTMAEGGVVTRPTLLLAGEGGEPEAIVPLSKSKQYGFGEGGGLNVTTIVNVTGAGVATTARQDRPEGSGAELGRVITAKVIEVIRQEQRPGGILAGSGRG
jgi:hypothetical protein